MAEGTAFEISSRVFPCRHLLRTGTWGTRVSINTLNRVALRDDSDHNGDFEARVREICSHTPGCLPNTITSMVKYL